MRVPDLLRAAAVLARRTVAQIALSTSIPRSRVERLLSARTGPRTDEVAQILATCGVDPALVTTPGPGTAGMALASLLNRGPEASSPPVLDACRLVIDKLSLTFNVDDPDAFLSLADRLGTTTETEHARYAKEFRVGRILVQHGEPESKKSSDEPAEPRARSVPPRRRHRVYEKRRSSRLDFNPSKAADSDRSALRQLLRCSDPSSLRITRIDVAIDMPVSIRRWQVVPSTGCKANVFIGKEGVETIYLGLKGSDHQVRAYDKDRERKERGKRKERAASGAGAETRFEAALRNVGGIDELRKLRDPFARLQFVDLGADGMSLADALLTNHASAFGAVALRSQIERAEFRRLASLWQTAAAASLHPSLVFAAHWPSARDRLLRLLCVR